MSEDLVDDDFLTVEDLETVKTEFIAYLDGTVAPLFAAESLSQMLRVEPPIYFTPKQLADLIAGWARLRAPVEQRLIHEFYLKSIELIVIADRTGVLNAFKPSPFYMPYFEGLVKSCPPAEKEQFRGKLKALRDFVQKEWGYEFRRAEVETPVSVETSDDNTTAVSNSSTPAQIENPGEIGELVDKLRISGLRLNPVQEEEIVSKLQLIMGQLLQQHEFIMTPYLEGLVEIAGTVFNGGKPLLAAQLLYLVQQVYSWRGFDQVVRECLRGMRKGRALDETQLKTLIGKPEMLSILRVFLTHYEDFSPYSLLTELIHEPDRQKRRLLLALIEGHGETAAPVVIDMLSRIHKTDNTNWFIVRNLVYLLGRVTSTELAGQEMAIRLIGPHLRSPYFQIRLAAIESLGFFSTEEALEPVKHVFDETSYTPEQLNNQERILNYLTNTIALIGKFDTEKALRLLIEISLGRHIDIIPEKLTRPLRLQAMNLILVRRASLSAVLIVPLLERIRSLTSRWKKIVSRLLGEDEQELVILLDIIAAVPTRPVIDLLNDIQSRYAKELSGRRAAELLAQLQATSN